MPFRLLPEKVSDADLVPLEIYFDPSDQSPWQMDELGNPIGEGYETMVFYLAPLDSDIINRIQDQMYSFLPDGSSTLKVGTSAERKLERAVKKWEGVTDSSGNEVKPNPRTLKRLPPWVQRRILDKINQLNVLTEEQVSS